MRKEIVLLTLVILMAVSVSANSIGAAPGFLDIGTVERGETVEQELYVTTNFNDPFTIQPELRPEARSNMFDESNELRDEISEESISDWIELPEESPVNPNSVTTYELPDGSSVNANGRFTFELSVPRDAEPGYHYGRFNLNPRINADEGSAGTVNWGEIRPKFRFRVPGDAERSIEIVDVEGLRSGDDSAVIRTDVRNTGTVTARLRSEEVSIYDSGQETDDLNLGSVTIAPGETETIETTWGTLEGDLQAGNYRVQGTMNYMTGSAFIDETFSITDFIQIEPSNNSSSNGGMLPSGEDGGSPPTLLIVMFLVIVGSLMYTMEIDPLLIIMALGAIGISAFIWFSGLPVILAGLVLIVTLFLFYYGWM